MSLTVTNNSTGSGTPAQLDADWLELVLLVDSSGLLGTPPTSGAGAVTSGTFSPTLERPLALALVAGSGPAAANATPEIDIPYDRFTLDNGLTVVVHEDRKAPIVAVSVWYHVGSKNEPQGKTGFAHLFEHLMFNGTENYNDDWFKPFDRVGGTGMNGTTNFDRTNYFQVVPKTRNRTTGLYESVVLTLTEKSHIAGARKAIDAIMKSAARST